MKYTFIEKLGVYICIKIKSMFENSKCKCAFLTKLRHSTSHAKPSANFFNSDFNVCKRVGSTFNTILLSFEKPQILLLQC